MALNSPVEAVLEQAGATMVDRSGCPVPLHFGSSAGELAACVVAVGLADRADLSVAVLTGPASAIEHATLHLTGTLIAPGGAYLCNDTAWCATAPGRLLVVGEGASRAALGPRLRAVTAHHRAVSVHGLGDATAGFELLGPRTEETLDALGLPRTLSPAVQTLSIGDAPATVVRRSWARALVLTETAWGLATWAALDRAGAPFGMTYVGADAVARFRFVEPLLSGAPAPR